MTRPTPSTHRAIDHDLCGEPVEMADGSATVRLEATDRMAVDDYQLVHGGFVFGAADHAAMLAVDDSNVVLGSADTTFLAPVTVGDTVEAEATIIETDGKKRVVETEASVDGETVFEGTFTAFVPDAHVLE
jgi:acyl-coenzyme A thioesterase PaaI-like protein